MPRKLLLDVDNETWKKVQKLKIDQDFKNDNETVVYLIKKGLREKE